MTTNLLVASVPNIRVWLKFYVDLGHRVVPFHSVLGGICTCRDPSCRSPGKHPIAHLVPRGLLDASSDLAMLESWWRTCPFASIAVATGPRLTVVDVDPRNGGNDSLAMLQQRLGPLRSPWTVRTGGGGAHFGFVAPSGVRCRTGIRPGIDLKAEGGVVVVPPSLHHSGGRYDFIDARVYPNKLPTLPDWFTTDAGANEQRGDAQRPGGGRIPVGARNSALTSMAGVLRRCGASGEVMTDVLREVNKVALDVGLEDEEVRSIVTSIAKKDPAAVLTFETPAELFSAPNIEVPWLLEGYLAEGAITELLAPPKLGKTTLELAMIASVLAGKPFVELPTARSPVVLLTEEHVTTLRQALLRARLHDVADLHVLRHDHARGTPWPRVVEQAVDTARRVGAKLLAVDTLAAWSLAGGDENSAADAYRALEPLQLAAAEGLAVLIARHTRKGGGDVVEAGRGSSAFAGAVDILVTLLQHRARPNARTLETRSRFSETPPTLVVELVHGAYVPHGDGRDIERHAVMDAVVAALPTSEPDAVSEAILKQQLEGTPHALGRTKLREVLGELVTQKRAGVVGTGTKNDAKRYWATEGRP